MGATAGSSPDIAPESEMHAVLKLDQLHACAWTGRSFWGAVGNGVEPNRSPSRCNLASTQFGKEAIGHEQEAISSIEE